MVTTTGISSAGRGGFKSGLLIKSPNTKAKIAPSWIVKLPKSPMVRPNTRAKTIPMLEGRNLLGLIIEIIVIGKSKTKSAVVEAEFPVGVKLGLLVKAKGR